MHLGTFIGATQLLVGGLRAAQAVPENPPYFQWHWGGDIQCLPVDGWDGVIGTWNPVGIFSENRSVRAKATGEGSPEEASSPQRLYDRC